MTALTFAIDARQVALLGEQMAKAPAAVKDELRTFVETVLPHLQREVVERTPTSQGTLRNSVGFEVRELPGLGIEGRVGSSLGYAVPVELGTRPHFVGKDGIDALEIWARQRLGVRGKEARSAAFAIATKISRVGTKGAFMFRDTFEANQQEIADRLNAAVARIADRIGGGE